MHRRIHLRNHVHPPSRQSYNSRWPVNAETHLLRRQAASLHRFAVGAVCTVSNGRLPATACSLWLHKFSPTRVYLILSRPAELRSINGSAENCLKLIDIATAAQKYMFKTTEAWALDCLVDLVKTSNQIGERKVSSKNPFG